LSRRGPIQADAGAPLMAELAYGEHRDEAIRPDHALVGARRLELVAALDRVAMVALPVAAILAVSGPSAAKLFTFAVASTIWYVALRKSSNSPGLSGLAIGTSVVAAVGSLTGLAAVSIVDFWLPGFQLSTRELLIMTACLFLTWSVFDARLQRAAIRRRLLFVGAGEAVQESLAELARNPRLPFDVIGVVDDERTDEVGDSPWLGTTGELGRILQESRPDLVVLGSEARRVEALSQVLDVGPLDARVLDVHHFNEHAFGKIPVYHLSPVWFMSLLHLYQRPYSRFVKRTFDVVIAGVALFFLVPVLALVGLIVRVSSPGPVFFRQRRLGEGGELFEILKFRTMVDGAEQAGKAVWAAADDARITAVGRVLRRTRLDEIPQLWNVLRGEMSIVGPRPERPEFLELLRDTVPFWTRRHLVKPGITGWAQVRRGYTADASGTAEKLAYDLYYLKYRSLLFDFAIAARTVGIVFSGFGSR
jgi:exopolysaccharide biosynthesis polyprenyl glycosylphosphotransferase